MKSTFFGLLIILFSNTQFAFASNFTDRVLDIAAEYNLSNPEVQSVFTDVISKKQLSPEAMEIIHQIQDEVDAQLGKGYRTSGPTLRAITETITKTPDDETRCGAPKGSTVFAGEYVLDMPNGTEISLGKQQFTAGGKLDKNIDVLEIGGVVYRVIYQYDSCSGLSARFFSYNGFRGISETFLITGPGEDDFTEFMPVSPERFTHISNEVHNYYLMTNFHQSGLGGSYKKRYAPGDITNTLVHYITESKNIDMIEVIYEENRDGPTPLTKELFETPPTDQPVTIERDEMKKIGGFIGVESFLAESAYIREFANKKELMIYEFSSASAIDMVLGLYKGDTLEKLYTHVIDYSMDEEKNMFYMKNYLFDSNIEEYVGHHRIIDATTGKAYPITEGNNCIENTFAVGFGKNYFFSVGYDYTAEVPNEVTVCFYDHQGNYKKSFITETNVSAGAGRYSYDRFGFVGDSDRFYTLRTSDALPDNDTTIMYVDINKNPLELYPLDSVIIDSEVILAEDTRIIDRLDTITQQGATAYEYLDQFLPW